MRAAHIWLYVCLVVPVYSHAQCEHGERTERVGGIPSAFSINYKDGTTENIIIKYEGHATLSVSQSGSSSTWNHPIDNRRCNWYATAYVARHLCIVSKSLGEQCEGNSTKVFYITKNGKGDSFNPFKTDFQGENCNKACGRFIADYDAAKKAVSASLTQIYESDLKPFLEQLKQNPSIRDLSR